MSKPANVKEIRLSWFRGSAEDISLTTGGKSVLVYGENGAGKSTFVDAIEYLISARKVGHLSHEYSGKNQELGLVNTKMPDEAKARVSLTLDGGDAVDVAIKSSGAAEETGKARGELDTWGYYRTVLRQDEVARFVGGTKGHKYSVLLPLLGLSGLEVRAENVRQLARTLDQQSIKKSANDGRARLDRRRADQFGGADDSAIVDMMRALYKKFTGLEHKEEVVSILALRTGKALEEALSTSSESQRLHAALRAIVSADVPAAIGLVRTADAKLALLAETLVAEKLAVLIPAGRFAERSTENVQCPACGRMISRGALLTHVNEEKERLEGALRDFESRRLAVAGLCESLVQVRNAFSRAEAKAWREGSDRERASKEMSVLANLDVEALRADCREKDLQLLEESLSSLLLAAGDASRQAPPEVKELAEAGRVVEFCRDWAQADLLAEQAQKEGVVVSAVDALEEALRKEIRATSQKVVGEITNDIQGMWDILHPESPITGVHLYYPDDADKALDIGLEFFGTKQLSPRLTLSEGFRNSLGLCIFWAMAMREAGQGRPLFLDDVIVSLDREHRSMVREVLEKRFGDRQVFIFTHDRDWYAELRRLLDGKRWTMRALLPFEGPATGLRWAEVAKDGLFTDALAKAASAPDVAANTARKVMDIEMAAVAEAIQLQLPYRQGFRNDHRTAVDFLGRIRERWIACYQKRVGKEYKSVPESVDVVEEAEKLLILWGNKGSHTFDVTKPEALQLIHACRAVLELFTCGDCHSPAFRAEDKKGKWVQCQCGALRWKYGKD